MPRPTKTLPDWIQQSERWDLGFDGCPGGRWRNRCRSGFGREDEGRVVNEVRRGSNGEEDGGVGGQI